MNNKISLIGAPTDIGAGTRGSSMGPEALRVANIGQVLEGHGLEVLDRGNLSGPPNPWQPPEEGYRHLDAVAEWNRNVHEAIYAELGDGRMPVLLGGDHCLGIGSISAVARHCREAQKKLRVLWLDAHADFNTPDTSPSGYLGGMGLAAACGRWDSGLGDTGPRLDPARITLCGVRDLDPGERVALELAGVPGVARLSEVADLVRDTPVFVHLDLDVLDPDVMPAHFPAPLGLSLAGLATVLLEVAAAAIPVGVEITAFEAPGDPGERKLVAARIADAVEPLLDGARQET